MNAMRGVCKCCETEEASDKGWPAYDPECRMWLCPSCWGEEALCDDCGEVLLAPEEDFDDESGDRPLRVCEDCGSWNGWW